MKKIIFITLLIFSHSAFAEWVLDQRSSIINFTTTKNSSKTEVQTFNKIVGNINAKRAILKVDLSSVDTGIAIRDTRLRELFFDVMKFPAARVSLDVRKAQLDKLQPGQRKTLQLDAVIDLHGVQKTLPVKVQIIAFAEGQIMVTSKEPLIIDLKDFDLLSGVEALRAIARLTSINTAIPVTFNLFFIKK